MYYYNWLIVVLLLFVDVVIITLLHWNLLGVKAEEVHYEIPREAAGNYEIPVASGTVSLL